MRPTGAMGPAVRWGGEKAERKPGQIGATICTKAAPTFLLKMTFSDAYSGVLLRRSFVFAGRDGCSSRRSLA